MKRFIYVVLVTVALALSNTSAGAQTYTVTDLGTLSGDTTAYAINASGQVAGYSIAPSGAPHAFIWTPTAPNGTIGAIRDLGLPSGDTRAVAFSINDKGQAAGWAGNSTVYVHAALFSGGAAFGLGTIKGSGQSQAYGINASGEITGSSVIKTGGSANTFLWKPNAPNGTSGTMVDLKVPGGFISAIASGINTYGQIAQSNLRFIWTPSTANATIGTSISAPWQPNAINDAGQTTGGAAYTWMGSDGVARSSSQAAWWGPTFGLQTLGFPVDTALPPGSGWYQGGSTWISNAGNLVGYAQARDLTAYPFPGTVNTVWMWSAATGMHDLNANPSIKSSGWLLTQVNGVNDLGQITGVGTYGGTQRAFLLTP